MRRTMLVSGLLIWALMACSSSGEGDEGGDTSSDILMDSSADVDAAEAEADAVPVLPPYEEPQAWVRVDLAAERILMPFPSDLYLDEEGRFQIDGGTFSNTLFGVVNTNDYVQEQLREVVRGYAPYAPLAFETSAAVDPASLPADLDASVAEGASVRLLKLGEDGLPAEAAPFLAEARTYETDDGPRHVVLALPAVPLVRQTRYALIVTDALTDTTGQAIGMSPGQAAILGWADAPSLSDERQAMLESERARVSPLWWAQPDPTRVAALTTFTVGGQDAELEALLTRFRKGGDFDAVPFSLEPDADHELGIQVGAAFSDCSMDADELAYGVYGVFEPPNFTGPDDRFVWEGDDWKVFESERVEFWLMVPPGEGPFPVVLAQHGINATHHGLCPISRDLVRAGVAVLRFDWPRHGERGTGGFEFLDITNFPKIRDNFRQAAVDMAAAVLLLEALAPTLDELPLGAPDGAADLDVSRIGYLGVSLGGIIGSIQLPFNDRIQAFVGHVTGQGLYHMVEVAILTKLATADQFQLLGMILLCEHGVWPSDPVAFAHHIQREPFDWNPEPTYVLIQEAMGDDTVPNASTEIMARAIGLPLIEPVAAPIAGLEQVPAEGATSGVTQYDGIGHDFLDNNPDHPLVDLARRQAITFLTSQFSEGTPRIITE